MVYTQARVTFYYLPTNNPACGLFVGRQVEKTGATELKTMASQGIGTQQKIVSLPLTIHPQWCTGECWFNVAEFGNKHGENIIEKIAKRSALAFKGEGFRSFTLSFFLFS